MNIYNCSLGRFMLPSHVEDSNEASVHRGRIHAMYEASLSVGCRDVDYCTPITVPYRCVDPGHRCFPLHVGDIVDLSLHFTKPVCIYPVSYNRTVMHAFVQSVKGNHALLGGGDLAKLQWHTPAGEFGGCGIQACISDVWRLIRAWNPTTVLRPGQRVCFYLDDEDMMTTNTKEEAACLGCGFVVKGPVRYVAYVDYVQDPVSDTPATSDVVMTTSALPPPPPAHITRDSCSCTVCEPLPPPPPPTATEEPEAVSSPSGSDDDDDTSQKSSSSSSSSGISTRDGANLTVKLMESLFSKNESPKSRHAAMSEFLAHRSIRQAFGTFTSASSMKRVITNQVELVTEILRNAYERAVADNRLPTQRLQEQVDLYKQHIATVSHTQCKIESERLLRKVLVAPTETRFLLLESGVRELRHSIPHTTNSKESDATQQKANCLARELLPLLVRWTDETVVKQAQVSTLFDVVYARREAVDIRHTVAFNTLRTAMMALSSTPPTTATTATTQAAPSK